MKAIKFKFFGFIVGALTVYLIIFYSLVDNFSSSRIETFVNLKHVVVHMDLKGAPLKLKYLTSLLPFFKKLGVNGLLMEYEDMFPYEGILINLSSTDCYNKTELKDFLKKADQLQIEIIPLVQTFGHMEHVLKLEEFQSLREVPLYPDSICPSNNISVKLLKDMLDQIIHFHASITPLKHIHIGCDEVYHMNKCDKCLQRNGKNIDLFINHLLVLKQVIFTFSPYTTVLIWDDMFRTKKNRWNVKKNSGIAEIEPVYWDYTPNLSVSHRNLYNYHKTFNNIWIASAYKGADGRQAVLPNLRKRLFNHYNWMNLILDYCFAGDSRVFNFKGIILTGWSRYSHMEPLCELFPAAIPSLILNLLLIQKFRFGIKIDDTLRSPYEFFNTYLLAELNRNLQCNLVNIDDLPRLVDTCTFDTVHVLILLKRYKLLTSGINTAFNDEGDLSTIEYNFKIKNINMITINRNMKWCNSTLNELAEWEKSIWRKMSKYYDTFVIDEFIGQKLSSMKKRVKNILSLLEIYVQTHTWSRKSHTFA